jgi:N-acetylmuramic acid 6-phosphate etherase
MVRLGKVYGNLMVDMKQTNAKLRDRGRRIVMAAGRVEAEERRACSRKPAT